MAVSTACIYCQRIGLVRCEHVVEGPTSTIEYYCGRCDRSWRVAVERADRKTGPDQRPRIN
jgi:hypothetical protein